MNPQVAVIGIGADGAAGLRPEMIERIVHADFLAGGERHLAHFPQARGERFVIRDNLASLLGELGRRYPEQRCVVLASGDPLFHGVGRILLGSLGPEVLRIEPAVSSMQLAFARVGYPWEHAALGSVHGRDVRVNLLPLLGRGVIGLFTQDGDSPAAVARFFLERGLSGYKAVVGENLGAADERVTRWPTLTNLAEQCFGPLNYLILLRTGLPWPDVERNRALVPGVPDEAFARPDDGPEVMTRQEVRSVVLAKLLGSTDPGDTVWDIGAGLGTVSVEIAVLRPHLEVIAVERDPARAVFLRQNRERFGAYNVRVVESSAPEALHAETQSPRLVFVGGSGGRLTDILTTVAERLAAGCRLVASFVTLEHLTLALESIRALKWPFEVTEVHIARSDTLAGLTGLKPQRGVFLLRADKPSSGAQTIERGELVPR